MGSYISITYLLLFLPIVAIVFSIVPKKVKPFILLAAGLVFMWTCSHRWMIYWACTTLSVYLSALLVERLKKKCKAALPDAENREQKKAIKKKFARKQVALVAVIITANILLLAVLRYSQFFVANFNNILRLFGSEFQVALPKFAACIGISFYTLQAVSYLHDVYKGKIEADRNLGRLALYMSFFPIIMEGPICRYSDTAMSLWNCERIKYKNFTFGMQRIAFGILKKVVVADRLNVIVTSIFREYQYAGYDGGIIFLGAVLYTIELYMEFSGTMDVVIGSGEIFGIKIPENFRQPFFSKSITEFWQRWHITLGTWFKDYIFYPVTMSKPMKKLTKSARKKLGRNYGPMPASIIAFGLVWLCNGLWHGAGWEYLFFGFYHFMLISLGSLILPLSNSLFEKWHFDRNKLPYRIFTIIRTAILVCIGEMFFNSRGLSEGMKMFKVLVTKFSFKSFFNGAIFTMGMDRFDYIIVLVVVAVVFAVGLMKEKGISPREWISQRHICIRWAIFFAMILVIVIFGAYGTGYIPIDPIYANF